LVIHIPEKHVVSSYHSTQNTSICYFHTGGCYMRNRPR